MSLPRWLLTFLAFPLGGLLAMLITGGALDPLRAALGGLVVGAVVGGAQWLALGRRAGAAWLIATALATTVGAIVAFLVVGAPTTVGAAVATGAIGGVLVGSGQAAVLRAAVWKRIVWAATVAASWALGWLITANVILDLDRGHAVFGSSGAVVVTIATGVALRLMIGPRPRTAARATRKAA
jgi:hypothetical protein